mgnify:CR=1 FL=1
MNEEDRRYLTEWGGDCWHDYQQAIGGRRCKKCGEWDLENRTFDTWEDFGWLVVALTERDLLWNFADYWVGRFPTYAPTNRFSSWLAHSPINRCQFICDFLREQEGKG